MQIPGALLSLLAFFSLNASSIPEGPPVSDASSQAAASSSSASSLSSHYSTTPMPDVSAAAGGGSVDPQRQPAGPDPVAGAGAAPAAASASTAHMVQLMWVLAARSFHGRLVWLACPGVLALAAAVLGLLGALRSHRSFLTWVRAVLFSALFSPLLSSSCAPSRCAAFLI